MIWYNVTKGVAYMETVARERDAHDVRGIEDQIQIFRRPKGYRFTEQEKLQAYAEIISLHNEGKNAVQIEKILGIGNVTIRKWIKNPDSVQSKDRYSAERKEEIKRNFVAYYNEGYSIKDAAKKAGTVDDVIYKWNEEDKFFESRPANKRYTKSEKEQLIVLIKELYDENKLSLIQISEILDISTTTIGEWNKENPFIDTSRTAPTHYTDAEKNAFKEEIKTRHDAGESIADIARDLRLTRATIQIWNKTEKFVDTRTPGEAGKMKNKIYGYDENFFEYIDSADKAYIVGFLMGDGCVYDREKSKRFKLDLQESDYQIIYDIAEKLNMVEALKLRARQKDTEQNKMSLVVNSTKMSDDLIKLGVVPRKTGIEPWVDLKDEKLQWAFIRGLMDADGCVTKNGSIRFFNSEYLLTDLQSFLQSYGIESKVNPKVGCFELSVRKAGSEEMCKHLYNDGDLKLNRKYDRLKRNHSDILQ
jgi:transposase